MAAMPTPLRKLEPGQNVEVEGVDVRKEMWQHVPVFIFTPPEGEDIFLQIGT